jgi:hypothetical protein
MRVLVLLPLVACASAARPSNDVSAWQRDIAPLVARDCLPCHLEGGEADVDLTSEPAWLARRKVLEDRLIIRRDMPPEGSPISEADRRLIARWLTAP